MKQIVLLEIIYKTIAYSSLFIGILLLIKPLFLPFINRQIRRYKNFARIRKTRFKENAVKYRQQLFLYRHLELLLASIWPWYTEATVIYYLILTFALFTVSTVTLFRITDSRSLSVLFGLFSALIPYLVLWLGLFWKRSGTSYDLVPVTNILLGKYRVKARNIYYSLVDTIKEIDQYRMLQKSLLKLTSSIQNHRNKEDLENALELFVYQIGTSWARQLGVLILNAQWESKNIEHSLSNLVKDMGKAQEIMEQEKSSNQETIQMGYFVPVVAFPASLLLLSKAVTSGRFLYFQFKTTAGLTSFLITSILCLAGFTVSLLLRKPRNEI